jgi:hypothetical protein
VKLKKVKSRRVRVLVEPGLAPHTLMVFGSRTTASRMALSTIGWSPKKENRPSARKMSAQTLLHIYFLFIFMRVFIINIRCMKQKVDSHNK